MSEKPGFTPRTEPLLAPHRDSMGTGEHSVKKRVQEAAIMRQIDDHFESSRKNITFNPEGSRQYYGDTLINPGVEIIDRGERLAHMVIDRNNAMADVLESKEYKDAQERQRSMRGNCAIGNISCIDGRIPHVHTSGTVEGVTETMGGVPLTSVSRLTGRHELTLQSLQQRIVDRPKQRASELLELIEAHAEIDYTENGEIVATSNCGAMKKFEGEAAEQGEAFKSTDLIAENFRLMEPAIEAITRTYNQSAKRSEKPELERVAVRTVRDTVSQGILLGYGDKQSFFTTTFLEQNEEKIRGDLSGDEKLGLGYYRESFTEIDRFAEKETKTTDLIEYFMNNKQLQTEIEHAAASLEELRGLTNEQKQALRFTLAKNMAFQWQTGLYKKELSENHPYSKHNEQFMAITLDDGYGATVGRYDPEIQVFAANTATITEAVNHVKTKIILMDHYYKGELPYVLFICSGIAESAADNQDVYKQALATLGRTFKGITQNEDVAEAIVNGKIVIMPTLLGNRSNRVIEVPNFLS